MVVPLEAPEPSSSGFTHGLGGSEIAGLNVGLLKNSIRNFQRDISIKRLNIKNSEENCERTCCIRNDMVTVAGSSSVN